MLQKDMFYLSTRIGDITVEELAQICLPVMVGLAVVSLVIWAVMRNSQEAANNAQPVRSATVRVVDKQQIPANAIAFELWVLFETQQGERVRVMCPANNSYVIGDIGYLRWQGSKLHSFDRGSTGPQNMGQSGAGSLSHLPAWKRVEIMEAQERQRKASQPRSCVFCGQALQEGQAFCGACGKRQD